MCDSQSIFGTGACASRAGRSEWRKAYNFAVVMRSSSIRSISVGKRAVCAAVVSFVFSVMAVGARAQSDAASAMDAGGQGKAGRVLLVLPFDNRTGQPSLEWIREAAAEVLSTRFASAGFEPTSRADRMYALDHLG